MTKKLLLAFAAGVLLAAGLGYSFLGPKKTELPGGTVAGEQTKQELLGYTRYRDYMAHGKQALQGQIKLLTATVTRSEVYTRHIRQKKFVFSFDALITIYYVAEYSFGYDLKADSYDIRDTDAGIEIILGRPLLVATPAIKSRSHDTPSTSWLIDENKALVELYEGMDKIVEMKGLSMAFDSEIVALCEKQLVEFFRNFLAKQPGVRRVPHIYITYRN